MLVNIGIVRISRFDFIEVVDGMVELSRRLSFDVISIVAVKVTQERRGCSSLRVLEACRESWVEWRSLLEM